MSNESEEIAMDQAFASKEGAPNSYEPAYSGALSYMRRRYTKEFRDESVDIVVSGVPFDLGTTNRPGARFGPRSIREASAQLYWGEPHWPWDFDPCAVLDVIDWGDVVCLPSMAQEMVDSVEAHATAVLQAGKSMLTFGGDHLVALPLVRAHGKHFGPISLIHFDAHTDTETEGGLLNHGCMFHYAVEEGMIDPARSIQIGIRTDYPKQDYKFRVLDTDWVHNHPLQATIDAIRETVANHPAYLTFDIDCLDPSYAPGTGTPVCGGLSTNQALQIVRGLIDVNLIGMDLVEVAPDYDVSQITSLAGAHLALDYLGVRAAQKLRDGSSGN